MSVLERVVTSYLLEPSQEEMNQACIIANQAQLTDVHLVRLAADVGRIPQGGLKPGEIEVVWGTPKADFPEVGLLRVELTLEIRVPHDGKGAEGAKVSSTVSAAFAADYAVPSNPLPESLRAVALPAFAQYNGLMNLWPYFRRTVQDVMSQMGVPGVVLGPMRVQAKKAQSEELQAPPLESTRKARTKSPGGAANRVRQPKTR